MSKLIIIEPWEFVTVNGENPFQISLTKGINDNWLITFPIPVSYNGFSTKYILSRPSAKYRNIDLTNVLLDRVILEIAFIENLNSENLMKYDLDKHRGKFLIGELSE